MPQHDAASAHLDGTHALARVRPAGVIYGLKLVDSDEIRYVGLTTKTAERRLREHRQTAAKGARSPRAEWMRKHQAGVVVVELESVTAGQVRTLQLAEIDWIARLRAEGHRLLNLTDGGEGTPGMRYPDRAAPSEETRQKISRALTGRKQDPELRAAQSERSRGAGNHFFGKSHSEEAREANRLAHLGENNVRYGQTHSIETRMKMSLAQRGEGHSQYGRRGPASHRYGQRHTEETKERIAAAQRGRPSMGMHVRWHVKRSVVNESCVFCQASAE